MSFGSAEDHYATLEHNRSQHTSRLLPASPPPAPEPETDPSIATEALGPLTGPRPENVSVEARNDAYWTDFRGPKALFMTVWRPSTRSAEHSCGIRQG